MPPGFHLDIYTLSVATVANFVLVALVTFFAWAVNRPVKGLLTFSFGLFIMCLGTIASIVRNLVPGNEIILAANLLTFTGMILLIQGLSHFRGRWTLPAGFVFSVYAAFLGPFCYFLFAHNDLAARVAVVSLFYAFFCFFASYTTLADVPARDRLIYWPSGIFFAIHGVLMLVRMQVALSGGFGNTIFSEAPVQIVSLSSINLVVVSCALSLLTASSLQLRRQAEALALYDPLTHLPNRRHFLDQLVQAEQRALESNRQLAVIYLDLDGFKTVNDTMGHQTGDEVLKTVAMRLSRALGAGDCLARIGGDEFVVLVEGVRSREHAVSLRDRLKTAVESETEIGGWTSMFRVSCGLALFPADGHTAEAVVREADAAMYQAKRKGRQTLQALAS
jgi:diguanylate cyclase (GGDEF)-like protein